jgi:hypothetical protein
VERKAIKFHSRKPCNSLTTMIRKPDATRHHAIQPLQMYAFHPPSASLNNLCLLESSGESSDVVGQLAVVAQELDICTINQNLATSLLLHVLFTAQRSKAPVLGNDNLLATRELIL